MRRPDAADHARARTSTSAAPVGPNSRPKTSSGSPGSSSTPPFSNSATLYPPVTACTSGGSLPPSAAEKSAWYFSAAPSATAAQQTATQAPLFRILPSLKCVEVLAGRDVEHAVGGDRRRVD